MNINPTAEFLIEYYEALLISQYSGKPKASATIGALMGGSQGTLGLIANAIYTQVRDAFDLATAQGTQLDFLGKLRGVTRRFASLDLSKTFIGITTYGAADMGTVLGIASYETSPQPPGWYTMTYEDFLSSTLLDGDFRRVIMFLAAVHSCDYAYGTIDAICYTFFAGNVNLKVTGNMALTYQHLTTDTDDLFEIISQMGLLPAPAGVSIAVSEVGSFS